jgi:hypothetical protein
MNVNLIAVFHFSDKTKPMVQLFRIIPKNTGIYVYGMHFEPTLQKEKYR